MFHQDTLSPIHSYLPFLLLLQTVLGEYIHAQMLLHAKALEFYTIAHQNLESISEEENVQVSAARYPQVSLSEHPVEGVYLLVDTLNTGCSETLYPQQGVLRPPLAHYKSYFKF